MYSGKPETVNQYWLVSKIYRTAGQIGIAFGTVLTSLIKLSSIHFAKKKNGLLLHKKKSIDNKIINLEQFTCININFNLFVQVKSVKWSY